MTQHIETLTETTDDVTGYYGYGQVYVVRPGDTLSGIAYRNYGNVALWPYIFAANRNQIYNPNLIYPGQVLVLP